MHLSTLVESSPDAEKIASTKRVKVNLSGPGKGAISHLPSLIYSIDQMPIYVYTHVIRIKIRDVKSPQDKKKFMNKTTIMAIVLHELSHLRHMNHSPDFALFLKDVYSYSRK